MLMLGSRGEIRTYSRHRELRNTLIYINLKKALFQNADDEYHVKIAQTLEKPQTCSKSALNT
jgi:hypothetical protein